MINRIEFTANNLTSYAGLYPLLNYTKESGIMQLLEEELVFEKNTIERIKMKHITTMLSLHFLGADKLDRVSLLKEDPLLEKGFGINVTAPENVSRFFSNFTFKTTQMLRNVNFKVFKKLLKHSKLKEITIDIDSTVENLEGNQEGATKGYNPGHKGNKCYNVLMAFCAELKSFITGYQRPGNTYTSNGAAEMIKEIIAQLKDTVEDIVFRMDSGYFSEEIMKIIEEAGYHYVIKGKHYGTILPMVYAGSVRIWDRYRNKEDITACCIKPEKWDCTRKFVVVRELKSEEKRRQIPMFEYCDYDHDYYVTNTLWEPAEIVWFYEKRGNCENYIKEAKYDLNVGTMILKSFWANEAIFQLQMLVYNIFLLFKMEYVNEDYRQWVRTFRFKYVFVAAKIVQSGRSTIMKMSKTYPYQKVFNSAS